MSAYFLFVIWHYSQTRAIDNCETIPIRYFVRIKELWQVKHFSLHFNANGNENVDRKKITNSLNVWINSDYVAVHTQITTNHTMWLDDAHRSWNISIDIHEKGPSGTFFILIFIIIIRLSYALPLRNWINYEHQMDCSFFFIFCNAIIMHGLVSAFAE